jgi:hypothetical protein
MPPSGNFLRAELQQDARNPQVKLLVAGRKQPEGEGEIYVVLQRGETLLTTTVEQTQTEWTAGFPDADPAFEAGQEIVVLGVVPEAAPSEGAFAWTSRLTIE